MLKYIIVVHIVVQIHTPSSTLTEHSIYLKMDTFKKIYTSKTEGLPCGFCSGNTGTKQENHREQGFNTKYVG